MFEEHPEGGTPPELTDDGDQAGTQEDGKDGADAGKDEGRVSITKGELGAWKSKAEKFNQLEAENRRLKAERDARQTTDASASAVDSQRQNVEDQEAYISRLEMAARAGNEDAKALLVVHRQALASEMRTLARMEMMEIPADERDDVKAFMEREGVNSPMIARRLMRGGDRYESLNDKVKRLETELAEVKRTPRKVEDTRIPGETSAPRRADNNNGRLELTPEEYTERINSPDPKVRNEIFAARRENRLKIEQKRR